jgi:invasion protein IalB
MAAAAKPAAPAAAGATGNAVARAKAPSGYSAKTRNGETVYCKKVARIGSNLETETCMTAAQVDELERRADWERQEFRKSQAVCGTGGCGGT